MLDIDGNLLGDVGGVILADMMSSLTELSVADCGIGSIGIQTICGRASNISLRSLDLSRNEIKEDGAQAVEDLLRTSSTLKTLRLVSCQLSPTGLFPCWSIPFSHAIGIKMISAGLTCASLEELNISENRITHEGAVLLSAALAYGQSEFTLKTLHMCYAGINHLTMEYLSPILKYCKNLTTIDFSSNDLADEGLSFLGHSHTKMN